MVMDIYELYGLTYDEIKIVEVVHRGDFISKAEYRKCRFSSEYGFRRTIEELDSSTVRWICLNILNKT